MGRLLSALLLLGALACGQRAGDYPPALELEPSERLLRDRAALASVKADPLADRLQLDLARAEAWLNRAEFLLNSDRDQALRDQLFLTAEGQISAVRAEYSRLRVRPLPPSSDSEQSSEAAP